MKLVPPEHVMAAVEQDYEQMRFMIFGQQQCPCTVKERGRLQFR
jgi:hypothetical protein